MPEATLVTIGNAYVTLARTVSALNDATRTKRVASIANLRAIMTLPPPFCVWVPDGGEFGRPEAIRDTGTVQQQEQRWSAYLGAAAFGPEEGTFETAGTAATGEDIASLMDALFAAVSGQRVYGPVNGIMSRAYPSGWQLYDVTDVAVIFRLRFFNPFALVV